MFYRILEDNGTWFMNIWSYGVYFIAFVYSISAPWQVYLDKKFLDIWGFYGVFNILSDFESLWYMIHEYMVLWGVYGVFMVYFITFA